MRRLTIPRVIAGLLALSCFFIYGAASKGATGLDMSFNPVLSAPGTVRGIIPMPGNRMLIYGTFTTVNGISRRNIAVVQPDGSLDQGFQVQDDINVIQIHAAAVQDDGKILIGGIIQRITASGFQANLFRLNTDGSLDTEFKTGGFSAGEINGMVRAIAPDSYGNILVGGDFSAPKSYLVRLNSDGTMDETFDTGTGPDSGVTHIALQSTGDVIIGGYFQNVNGTAKHKLARLNASGSLYEDAFGTGLSGGDILSLAVQPDNRVLAGGSFSRASGQDAPVLARYTVQGELEADFSPYVRNNQLYEVMSLAVSDNYIFAGGWNPVMIFNGSPTDHDASFFVLKISDGGFHSYLNFKGKPTEVNALALRSDGSVVAGGSFIQRDNPLDEDFYAGLVRMEAPYYNIDKLFRPVVGGQAEILALELQADGQILVGGDFYRANDNVSFGLTRLNSDGSSGSNLIPPGTEAGLVKSLLVREDGRLVAAGYFKRIEDGYYVNREEIVLLEPDGTRIAGADISGVKQMAWDPEGKIIVVCISPPGVMRLNSDLTVDLDFNPGEGISNSQRPDWEFDRVNAVTVQPDGKILLGGSFSSFSEQPAENIIRLNADGSRDYSFISPGFTVFNFRSEIFSMAVQPDGKFLLGGRFSTVGGIPGSTVVRLHQNGTVDNSFQSAFADQGGTAYSIVVQPNGRILMGGEFQLIEGENIYNSLVRLNNDGSRDRSFNASLSGKVKSLLVGDEFILAGGSLASADGIPRQGLVRYVDLFGDVNSDGRIDLEDVILLLRLLAGDSVEDIFIEADINNDGLLGLPETIYLLGRISGMN